MAVNELDAEIEPSAVSSIATFTPRVQDERRNFLPAPHTLFPIRSRLVLEASFSFSTQSTVTVNQREYIRLARQFIEFLLYSSAHKLRSEFSRQYVKSSKQRSRNVVFGHG
jgi:hypothetical protein